MAYKRHESLRIPTPQPYIKPIAKGRVEYLFKHIPEEMQGAYDEGTRRFCKLLLRVVKKAMTNGVPPPDGETQWDPLSERTLKKYSKWGVKSTNPWYGAGDLYKHIQVLKANNKNWNVGFPRGMSATHPNPKYKGDRPTMNKLMQYLEDPLDRPKRPIWSPAFNSVGGAKKLSQYISKALKEKVKEYKGVYLGR